MDGVSTQTVRDKKAWLCRSNNAAIDPDMTDKLRSCRTEFNAQYKTNINGRCVYKTSDPRAEKCRDTTIGGNSDYMYYSTLGCKCLITSDAQYNDPERGPDWCEDDTPPPPPPVTVPSCESGDEPVYQCTQNRYVCVPQDGWRFWAIYNSCNTTTTVTVPADVRNRRSVITLTGNGTVVEGEPVVFKIRIDPSRENTSWNVFYNVSAPPGDIDRFFSGPTITDYKNQRPHPRDSNGMNVWHHATARRDGTLQWHPVIAHAYRSDQPQSKNFVPVPTDWSDADKFRLSAYVEIVFPTVDDAVPENDGEITLRLSGVDLGWAEPPGGWNDPSNYTATVKILDNDSPSPNTIPPNTSTGDAIIYVTPVKPEVTEGEPVEFWVTKTRYTREPSGVFYNVSGDINTFLESTPRSDRSFSWIWARTQGYPLEMYVPATRPSQAQGVVGVGYETYNQRLRYIYRNGKWQEAHGTGTNRSASVKLSYPTVDDNIPEDDGYITLKLSPNVARLSYTFGSGWNTFIDFNINRPPPYALNVKTMPGDSRYPVEARVKILDNDAPKERTVSVTSDQSVSGVTEGPYVYATASVRVSPPVPVGESVTVPVGVTQSGDVVYDSAANTGQRSVVLRATSSPLGSAEVKVLIHDDLVDEPSGAVTFSLGQPRAGPGSRVVYKLGTPRSVTVPVFDNDCPAGQHRYANTCHDDHTRGCVASGVGFYRDHRNGDLDDHYNAPKPVCACPSGQHRHGTAACTANHLVPACSPDRDNNYYVHVNGAHVQRSIQQCACANTDTGEPQHRHTVGHRTDNQCHTHRRPACLSANPREYWRIPVSGRRDDGRHDTFTLAACACPSGEHRHGSSGACHDHTPPLCSLEGQSFHTHTSGAQDATDVRDGYVAACPGELPKIKRVGTIRVGESANNAIIRVELNKPVRAGEIGIIRVETVNGTATPGADYKLIRGDDLRVNVGAGERSAVVRIPIVDDTEVEDDEHFTVILEAFGDLRNTRRIARVVIIDDDTPPDTTIEAVSPRVVEGEQVSFVVQLSRTYKDTLRVRVRVRESGDMLTRKADERVHEVRIRPGSTAGYLTLRTQDDQTNEKASNITAVIQNPVTRNLPRYQYNVGTPASAAVRVVDNDRPPPVIGLSSDSAQITEGDTITLKASMLSTRDSDIDVRVNIGETSFAAEAGQTTGDHLQPGWETQHTISIPAGSVSATKVVQTTDDTTDEADSTVTAAVQTHPTYLGTPDTQTVVQDNDNRYNKQTCAEQGKDYDNRLDECFVGFPR